MLNKNRRAIASCILFAFCSQILMPAFADEQGRAQLALSQMPVDQKAKAMKNLKAFEEHINALPEKRRNRFYGAVLKLTTKVERRVDRMSDEKLERRVKRVKEKLSKKEWVASPADENFDQADATEVSATQNIQEEMKASKASLEKVSNEDESSLAQRFDDHVLSSSGKSTRETVKNGLAEIRKSMASKLAASKHSDGRVVATMLLFGWEVYLIVGILGIVLGILFSPFFLLAPLGVLAIDGLGYLFLRLLAEIFSVGGVC